MPTLSFPNTFVDGATILASEHNANNNATATLLNVTKLDGDNIQDNGIATAKLQDSCITTQKIADSNVTLAKLAAALQAFLVPTGVITPYAGSSAPTGWLACDGSAVNRVTYSALYSAIGTTWGSGDGSTTFNLPDLRGRAVIGDGTGSGLTARTLGTQNIGEETHVLTEAELAAHSHRFFNYNAGNYSPAVGFTDSRFSTINYSGANLAPETSGIESTGSSNAHNNMQPSAVVKFLIKT
jgi:microcystin-dependent protein